MWKAEYELYMSDPPFTFTIEKVSLCPELMNKIFTKCSPKTLGVLKETCKSASTNEFLQHCINVKKCTFTATRLTPCEDIVEGICLYRVIPNGSTNTFYFVKVGENRYRIVNSYENGELNLGNCYIINVKSGSEDSR